MEFESGFLTPVAKLLITTFQWVISSVHTNVGIDFLFTFQEQLFIQKVVLVIPNQHYYLEIQSSQS